MIIIIAVAVIWGIYEVGNSVMFKNNGGEVMSKEHNDLIVKVKNIKGANIKEIIINGLIELERITQEEANDIN